MNQKVAVGTVYVAAMFMSIMDGTIVNVALPTIGRTFGVRATSVASITIAYLVSMAVFIPASGWLADRLGAKRVLLVAIAMFTCSSALCGLASSLAELVLFRVLQGVGGGMLAPVGMAMLFRVFPPAERIKAAAILSLPTTLAPASGPVLGGLLVTTLSWRWVFYVNVPIGLAAVTFGAVFLRPAAEQRPGRFDIVGFLLSGIGLGLLMYGASEGPVVGWRHFQVLGTLAAGVVLLAAMIVVELRIPNPIVSLRLLHDGLFRTTTAILALSFGGFVGSIYAISLYYQDGRGRDALVAGLSTFPEAVGVMFGAQIASRYVYPTLGPRLNIFLGLLGATAAMALLALMGADTSLWWSRLFLFAGGFSMAQVFVPVQAAAFATIPPGSTSSASTMFNTFQQVAGAGGVALLTTVIVALQPTHVVTGHVVSHLVAYRAAFAVGAACALVGAIGALFLHDRDAIGTVPTGRYRRRHEAGVQPRRILLSRPPRVTDRTHTGCS